MIEVVFGDSACGSLKMAQRFGTGACQGGSICVIGAHSDGSRLTEQEIADALREAEEKQRLALQNAVPMNGDPADVYGFGLMLSIGDISGDCLGADRARALKHLYSVYPEDGGQLASEILDRARDDLKAVSGRVADGDAVRIWYSDQPDEFCGLYWFMAALVQASPRLDRIYLAKLPEWEDARKCSWGEVAPEEWHRYQDLKMAASPSYCKYCAERWRALQDAHAPLRAVLNGEPRSVSEELYDAYILREIEAEAAEFQEARLIGRVLLKYRLGMAMRGLPCASRR